MFRVPPFFYVPILTALFFSKRFTLLKKCCIIKKQERSENGKGIL